MKAMFWAKMKMTALVLAGLTAVGVGGGAAIHMAAGEPPALKAVPATVPADAAPIFDDGSCWRFHVTLRKPLVPGKDGGAGGIIKCVVPYRDYPGIENIETPPPPAEWASPDFDDAEWARGFGRNPSKDQHASGFVRSVSQMISNPGIQFSSGVISLRGKFAVTDPAAVKGLYLKLAYRGGAVVYLNGREVARQDLPEGKLDAAAAGAAYPDEAWVDSAGKLIPDDYHAKQRVAKGEKDLVERIAKRDRSLGPVELPREALRKGVNVLAVEIHRSPYHPAAVQKEFSAEYGWVPCGLLGAELRASGTGAVANTGRPKGLQVWNHDVNDRAGVGDYGDPNEKLRPITMVGARNATFSGKVMVGSDTAIKGLKAVASDLKAASGGGVIPAAQLKVRWARLDGLVYKQLEWFDALTPEAPAEVPVVRASGAIQPIYLTVRVPKDAPAGEYRGTLTISAGGAADVPVPVVLQVGNWTVPDPVAFRTYVGMYQSPTSLALQYNVKEWSEEHWKLVDRSFALLAELGNKIVNIPVVERTQFGNDEGMVIWVRKEDGSFEYDFSVFDRFVELTKKRLGVPDVVGLQIWHSGGWEARKANQENTVTVLDRKTGQKSRLQVPSFDSDESKKFWKPVLEQIRERLAKQGMEKGMAIGILSDGTAPAEVFKAFDEIWPGGGPASWTRGCHSVTRDPKPYAASKLGGRVVLHEFCYGMSIADPDKGLPPIWKQRSWPGTAYVRHNFDDTLSLLKYRTFAERALFCGTRGIGRTCLDFWDCAKDDKGRGMRVFNRYPFSSCGQREPNLWRLAWPGPDGAEPTARFLQMLEGIQMAEALIVVAEAQGEKDKADAIGAELAGKCRQIYVDRLNYARAHAPEGGRVSYGTVHLGWQELDRRVFELAAEVEKKLGKK